MTGSRFGALRHRDFRLFWGGQLVSLVGTWMQSVGQAWLVLELTGSPFQLGLVNALQFIPVLTTTTTSTVTACTAVIMDTSATNYPGNIPDCSKNLIQSATDLRGLFRARLIQ